MSTEVESRDFHAWREVYLFFIAEKLDKKFEGLIISSDATM